MTHDLTWSEALFRLIAFGFMFRWLYHFLRGDRYIRRRRSCRDLRAPSTCERVPSWRVHAQQGHRF